jgi:hypothetical protein
MPNTRHVLLSLAACAVSCGAPPLPGGREAPAASTETDGSKATATARFAAHEGRYSMLSTSTGADGHTDTEAGTMDLWVEADGAARMAILLGDDHEPEGWGELREDPGGGRVRWVTVTGRFEPTFGVWVGRALPDGPIAMDRVAPAGCGSGQTAVAVFSFPEDRTVRLVLTTRAADGAVDSTEAYVFTRTGPAERRWAPVVPLTQRPDAPNGAIDCPPPADQLPSRPGE